MKKTAKEWQKQLNLEEEPDTKLLELLEAARDDIPKRKVKGKPSGTYSFKTATEPFEKTLANAMLGDLLSRARKKRGLTMQAVSDKSSVTRGRIAQIENKANLELQTFVRQADVLGYDVVVTLKSRDRNKENLSAVLESMSTKH
jgi:DNA-directed RNA polymerase sigma subunit (sigma70/sigma32)